MSDIWHPASEPPDNIRQVMLRFDPKGKHDCQGLYSQHFSAYARSLRRIMQLRFLHPTHWRELTEEERDEI